MAWGWLTAAGTNFVVWLSTDVAPSFKRNFELSVDTDPRVKSCQDECVETCACIRRGELHACL